jgi:hypothetical protein
MITPSIIPPTLVSPLSATRTNVQAEWPASVKHIGVGRVVGCQWCARTSHATNYAAGTTDGRAEDDRECLRVQFDRQVGGCAARRIHRCVR